MLRPGILGQAFWLILALGTVGGCGVAPPREDMAVFSANEGYEEQASEPSADAPGTSVGPPDAEDATRERKIIYTAQLSLLVDDLAGIAESLGQLVQAHGGYIARSDLQTARGRRRSGEWTVRVPVTAYGDFLTAAATLGELQSRREDSQEVTAEFYDLQARLRNKQREEERLLQLLETQTGDLQDVLEVERALSRVREEVERFQGSLRMLQDQTSLSTVTLQFSERESYVPVAAPRYATRLNRTWHRSLVALVATAQNLSIAAVACVPWLVAGIPLWIGLAFAIRRRRRRKATRPTTAAP